MSYPFGVTPPCGCCEGTHFDSFNCYALSFEQAARELARRPEAQDNENLQAEICHNYGIFLNSLTDDEIFELENQIKMCTKGGK